MTKLKTLLKPLKFDYINPDVTDGNFPDDGRRGKVELIRYDKYMSSKDVIADMKQRGGRPATVHELLIWAKDNWNDNHWIVALGSVANIQNEALVCSVWFNGRERKCDLLWFDRDWNPNYWFGFVSESGKLGASSETWPLEILEINGVRYKRA